jgi:hypothetical protein
LIFNGLKLQTLNNMNVKQIATTYTIDLLSSVVNYYTNESLTDGSIVMVGFICFRIFVVMSSYLMFPTMNVFVRLLINFAWPKFVGSTLEGLGVMTMFRHKTSGYRKQISQFWTNFWTGPSMDLSKVYNNQMFVPVAIVAFVLTMTAMESFAAQKYMLVASYLMEIFFGSRTNKWSVQWMNYLGRTKEDEKIEVEIRKLEGTVVVESDVLTEKMFEDMTVEAVDQVVVEQEVVEQKQEQVVDEADGFELLQTSDLSDEEFEEL